MNVILKSLQAIALATVLIASQASASVVISATRVIFPGGEREVTIKLSNEGSAPALVQAWIDKGDANASPDTIDAPFVLTPAMFRLEPSKGQTLRLMYTNEPLPADKESLFWLNVLEIPPKAAASDAHNQLQVAFRTRIKIMYRPQNLPGKAHDAPAQVRWQIERGPEGRYVLKATNPTPYVVNVGSVQLHSGADQYDAGAGYVLPGGTQEFPVAALKVPPAADAKVRFGSINDWGASTNNEMPVAMR
ncbi:MULTISPECIES: molecular chaperone [unclassified Burkholderia]|uniref:fimbrial biogenesis chaperone n=1 Tax=unclassified Burkholderia TaxID=2613784 RepID=UPI001E29EF70|nr:MULTISPECIES: fimbria/pilus periplasmic chaperone [unclassified Burkholderia]UEP27526.1 fimbria/pilus periplasmic chaperone [Burkholderia sp. B21-007]UEP41063.1 fimbria/pilus periplasmic chaperone [Burkholderia sp. B21-005]